MQQLNNKSGSAAALPSTPEHSNNRQSFLKVNSNHSISVGPGALFYGSDRMLDPMVAGGLSSSNGNVGDLLQLIEQSEKS